MNNDLISRSALIDDIDASVVFTVKDGVPSAEMRGANKIMSRIKSALSVDAVEVVRCKDCEHATDEGEFGHFCRQFPFGGMGGLTNDDDFCSYGERKDGAE